MRSRERQSEIIDWIEKSNCDICAVNETGLTGEEYMKVCDRYSWFAVNREWTKVRSGGAGFIIKKGIRCEERIDKMANSEEDIKVIMEKVNECVVEYGLKVNEKKSKLVCINGEVGRRWWMMGDCCIREVEEYQYLGTTMEGEKHCGFKSMGDRMKEAHGLLGIVKYAAERSGSKYVIGREGWKIMIVSKLMYGCGALAWYQRECDDLEVI